MSHTLLILLVALFLSALFSGLEIAFLSSDKLRFEMDLERHTFSSRLLERLQGLRLKLKLQHYGHLMRRTDSFEKTLMLGKVEGRRRRRRG